MTEDTAKILDKIKKLHMKAESCKEIGSEAEAQAFAEMVVKLLNNHKLSMTDIQFDEQQKSEPVDQHRVIWEHHGMKSKRTRVAWIERMARHVARAYSCEIVVHPGSSIISLVGTESNRDIAEYVIVTLVRAAEKIATREYNAFFFKCRDEGHVWAARGFRDAFLTGFINKIRERLDAEKARAESGCTALVRFDKERAAVKEFLDAPGKFTTAAGLSRSSVVNRAGYDAGSSMADRMDISGRAVDKSTAAAQKELS